jgi:hypothetical protein
MDGDLDLLAQQSIFDILHEEPFATDVRQRIATIPVSSSSNNNNLGRQSRMMDLQCLGNPSCLPQG